MSNIQELRPGDLERLGGIGGPPMDTTLESLDKRLLKVEAVLPTLATKEDLAELKLEITTGLADLKISHSDLRQELHKEIGQLRGDMFRAINDQTWKLVAAAAVLVAGSYFAASAGRAQPSQQPAAQPAPVTIQAPAAHPAAPAKKP